MEQLRLQCGLILFLICPNNHNENRFDLNKKQILAISLGNTLEWLDFGLIIYMAPLIGATFFPHRTTTAAALETLTVFAAGFICRPLGGIIFGHFGDTLGRAKPLRFSVLLIALSTILVGILPSYESIGWLSPLLFTLIRLAQGISIGGEYTGVMIMLAESAPKNRRGFLTSFAASGANLGFLLATVLLVFLKMHFSKEAISDWAWRLPFLLAGLPGILILYYRFKLSETRVYARLQSTHHLTPIPFLTALTLAPRQLLIILGLTCMSSSFYYIFFGFMPTYLDIFVGVSLQNSLLIQSLLLIAMLILVPIAGLWGDLWNRRNMLLLTAVCIIIFALPCFQLLESGKQASILLAMMIATFISSLDQGNSLAAVVENCPENVRYSGIAFSYNLGMALFGGTAPIIVSLLIAKNGSLSPAYYLMGMASISLLAASRLLRDNQSMQFIDFL